MRLIDPFNITIYDRTPMELEAFWMFCIMVAGKGSMQTAGKLNAILTEEMSWPNQGQLSFPALRAERPFHWILDRDLTGTLDTVLRRHKVGQYTRIGYALTYSANHLLRISGDLKDNSVEDLMWVPGVGPKTARFFLLHSKRYAECVVLDTHILKYLREECGMRVPTTTPSGKLYEKIEQKALVHFRKKFPGQTLADIDLSIWKQYARK